MDDEIRDTAKWVDTVLEEKGASRDRKMTDEAFAAYRLMPELRDFRKLADDLKALSKTPALSETPALSQDTQDFLADLSRNLMMGVR